MENDPSQEERTRAAGRRAADAHDVAESLEERAEEMHRASAAAQSRVAQFAEKVRDHDPDIADKLDVDPDRYRRRAAEEIARADHAHQRRIEDMHGDAEGTEQTVNTDNTENTDKTENTDGA